MTLLLADEKKAFQMTHSQWLVGLFWKTETPSCPLTASVNSMPCYQHYLNARRCTDPFLQERPQNTSIDHIVLYD